MLNYLGYSWVDQGVNLEEAFKMLRRAVELRPERRLHRRQPGLGPLQARAISEAAQTLERAVDLKPADPVLNDHLGDAYWHVNRKVEAQFQWNHARDMNPEPEDLPGDPQEDRGRPARCARPARRRTRLGAEGERRLRLLADALAPRPREGELDP